MDVTVIVATYGSEDWERRGEETARATQETFPKIAVTAIHGNGTLAEARNTGAHLAMTEWLCFLDADDSLDPEYFKAMRISLQHTVLGGRRYVARMSPLLAPRVSYDGAPSVSLATRNIAAMNPCVIGTLVRRERFMEAGGFWEEPAWEDWSLFRRCWLLGSRVQHVLAVYNARGGAAGSGRNLTVDDPRALQRSILDSHRVWKATR